MRERLKELLKISNYKTPQGISARFANTVHLVDSDKSVCGTNGVIALFDRQLYGEAKATAQVMELGSAFTATDEGYNKGTPIGVEHVVPKSLEGYVKAEKVSIPAWVGGLKVHAKEPVMRVAVIDGEATFETTLAKKRPGLYINLRYLALFGEGFDLYRKDNKSPVVLLPHGATLENAPWYALVMPVSMTSEDDYA